MKKTILLIRHGKTENNGKGKYFSGVHDVPLCAKGEKELNSYRGALMLRGIGAVYTSALCRAVRTAEILLPGIERYCDERLNEVDFGDYEGRVMTDENMHTDPVFSLWTSRVDRLTFPGGDDVASHACDAVAALYDIASECNCAKIAVVSHSATIRLTLSHILYGDICKFRSIPCSNARVSVLTFDGEAFSVDGVNLPIE